MSAHCVQNFNTEKSGRSNVASISKHHMYFKSWQISFKEVVHVLPTIVDLFSPIITVPFLKLVHLATTLP